MRDQLPDLLHVYPIKDLRRHRLGDAARLLLPEHAVYACWCQPVLEQPTPHTWILIHRAADGRELVERYGVQ